MNYKEFKSLIQTKVGLNVIFEEDGSASYGAKPHERQSYSYRPDPKIEKKNKDLDEKGWVGAITHESGESGGSCWGGVPSPFSNKIRKPYPYLEKILTEVAPNISFVNFRIIPVKEGSYEKCEYYGNYTEYEFEYVLLDELYDYLVKIGSI